MLKALLLWLGTLGLLLSLVGLLGETGEGVRPGSGGSSTYSAPVTPELPTAIESQAETLQNIPALTF